MHDFKMLIDGKLVDAGAQALAMERILTGQ
jgi:hypothetical protein